MHGSAWGDNDGDLLRVLTVIGVATFHTGIDSTLVNLNPAARDLVGRFFTTNGGKLRPLMAGASIRFERFVSGAQDQSVSTEAARHIVLRARNGTLAVCSRINTTANAKSGGDASILVLVKVVGLPAPDINRILNEDLELSPAEARLAIALHRHCDLGAAADTLGLSKETVRSQIRAIFAKLGMRKQSEVVRLVEQISSLSLHV